jgi:hypothetical protein
MANTPGRWIGTGWDVVRQDLGSFILITLVAIALSMVGSFVVGGPLLAGMFIAVRRKMVDGRTDLMDLFAGFNFFLDAFLIYIIAWAFWWVGLALLIIPALIVSAFYLFPFPFLIDRKLSFWDALESSRKLVSADLTGNVLFVLRLVLLNLLGALLFGVGLLVTVPVSVAAIAAAYKEKVGFGYIPPASPQPIIIT